MAMLLENLVCRVSYLLTQETEPRTATLHPDGTLTPPEAAGHLRLTLRTATTAPEVRDTPSMAASADGTATEAARRAAEKAAADIPALRYQVLVEAALPLQVTDCIVTFAHAYGADERMFLNGYQSWTDSCEHGRDDRMRGLHHVPRSLVTRYVLDGSGDYRFTAYPDRPGQLHGYTYAYLRSDLQLTLVGSLSEDEAFTLIRTDRDAGTLTLQPECPPSALAAGERRTLLRFLVAEGAEGQVFDRWFSCMGISPLPARALVGYTSWYRHYGDISAAKLLADLEGVRTLMGQLDVAGLRPLFQVDDGYARVGDWTLPDPVRFPEGLAPVAAAIRDADLCPGIWLAPFVCERDSLLFAEHPDWLLRDADGRPVETGCNWSGAFALDTRDAEVRTYVRQVLGMVTREWGFKLLKLDFLFAACMLPHDGMTRAQLMVDAMDLLRSSVDADVVFLSCGVPLASVFGRTEYCRVGCDVGLDWDDKPWMRLIHRERISTRNNRMNTLGRAHLDRRAFRCDPDVFILRDGVKLDAAQRRTQLDIDARMGGVLLTSDDMAAWSPAQMEDYRNALRTFQERNRDDRI